MCREPAFGHVAGAEGTRSGALSCERTGCFDDRPFSQRFGIASGSRWWIEIRSAPASAVRAARALVMVLLEQFGVERTAVLQPDGTMEPRAAAVADQQLVH